MTIHQRARRRGAALALLALGAMLLPVGITSAHAEDAYRYWSYWWGTADGSWEYAASGPADRVVTDGDVEGWRFLTSAEAVPSAKPGAPADFAALCPDGGPTQGQVRVGIVIDFGTTADTPSGDAIPEGENPQQQCITVAQGSTAEQVLAAANDVRSEQGAVCGIAGYPAAGCFEVVAVQDTETAAPTEGSASGGLPIWPVVIM